MESLTTEKWQELKQMYGDRAWQMVCSGKLIILNVGSNHDVENNYDKYQFYVKPSAELPFDYNDYLNGALAEYPSCFYDNRIERIAWVSCKKIEPITHSVFSVHFDDKVITGAPASKLRLKTPPRVDNKPNEVKPVEKFESARDLFKALLSGKRIVNERTSLIYLLNDSGNLVFQCDNEEYRASADILLDNLFFLSIEE
jgi:hypothetical protein